MSLMRLREKTNIKNCYQTETLQTIFTKEKNYKKTYNNKVKIASIKT